jgi:putative hydrolase of the HAD superfamily
VVQEEKLTKSNINHYFKTITNSEMVGVKKPNPEIFNYALKLANVSLHQSIMIGDSYEADILGALNIGMDAIFFDINNVNTNSDVKQINNLIHLKKYL